MEAVHQVNGGNKGDEEASLKMELEVDKETFCAEESFQTAESANSVTELSCAADASCVEELTAAQVSTKKKKKKLAAQEKMRVVELENAELKDQLSFAKERLEQTTPAEEKLNTLQEDLANLLSENKELQLERSKENTKDSSLQAADIQTPREEELERLLEAAELSAKDAKEKLLMSTTLELSTRETRVNEMCDELEVLRTSERQLKEDLWEAESLLVSTKNELQEKASELEEVQLKLEEEVAVKNSVEASFRSQEEQALKLQEDLAVTADNKELLEAAVAELTENFDQMRDRCIHLESELKLSREELGKVDALAADSLLRSSQLEQKLKSVEQLQGEYVAAAAAAQKNIELEDLLRSANTVTEEARLELQESESKLEEMNGQVHELRGKLEDLVQSSHSKVEDSERRVSEVELLLETQKSRINDLEQVMEEKCGYPETESAKHSDMVSALTTQLQSAYTATEEARLKFQESEWKLEGVERTNAELEHQLTIFKSQHDDADRKFKEQSVEVSGLRMKLEEMETENEQMNSRVHELSGKIFELESELSQYLVLTSELEAELKKLDERCAEHERRADATNERNLELQDLVRSSHLKIEDLEQEIDCLVRKCDEAEAASKEYADMASALTTELDKSRVEVAAENERQLAESLTEERRKSEEALHDSLAKLQGAENLRELLHTELVATQGKLESVENDLEEAGIRENEITKKLESAQVQLQQQGKVLDEATTKTVAELESVNDILIQDTEELTSKVSELQQLLVSANAEWEEVAQRLASSMNTIVELTDERARSTSLQSETEARFLEAQAELHDTIQKLTSKELEVKELDDKCSNLEDQLKIHEVKVYELSDIAESRKAELDWYLAKVRNQEKMNETLEAKLGQLEMHTGALTKANSKLDGELAESQSKMNDLHQKLSAALAEKDSAVENIETSLKVAEDLKKELSSDRHSFQCIIASIMDEKQLLGEANTFAENGLQTLIAELDRQLKEYKESNGALKDELENLKLQVMQNSILHSSVEEIEEQLLMNEAQFNKEIASIMEEKQLLSEANTVAQNELQALITQLEEQLVEYKAGNEALHAELENTKLQAIQYSALQTRVKELEELLLATKDRFEKEVESIEAAAAAREAEMTSMLEQYVQKLRDGEAFNEKKEENFKLEFVQESAEIYPLEPVIYKEKGGDPGEAKSLDIRSNISTPKKKKMKKPGKSSKETPSPTTTEANAPSPLNNIKIAVGVGLVSIIASILAGKK